jgi:hypothetical protein
MIFLEKKGVVDRARGRLLSQRRGFEKSGRTFITPDTMCV